VIQPRPAPVTLVPPHGGTLVDRFVTGDGAAALIARPARLPRLPLDARTAADLELIATGAASPLTGFVTQRDYAAILADSRLASGTVWPVPFTLAVDDDTRGRLSVGGEAALHDERGRLLGTIAIADLYARDPRDEWSAPGSLVGGDVDVLPLPADRPLARYRLTPRALRDAIAARGWKQVAGFATDAPIDRADEHRTKLALEISDGLVIHAHAGEPGRFDGYQGLLARSYPHARTILAAFPGAPRAAGPRELLLDAILRKNYGITRLIVSPDDAEVFDRFPQRDLGVAPLRLERPFHCRACDGFVSSRSCPHGPAARGAAPVTHDRGFILWFTGLSGAGKSTLAGAVARQLGALRRLEVLDGDEVRTHLSKGLGFSKEDRDVNIQRIAFVARTLAQHGVGVVTAAISPYADTRAQVRALAEARGIAFVEVYVNAKLESLVARDVKGLYKKALAGEVTHFTGVSDPYEPPTAPDVEVATDVESIDESVAKIVAALRARGLVPSAPGAGAAIHALAAKEP
jgi:sulfate adenylyltransferase